MTGAPPDRKEKENTLVSTLVGWGFGAHPSAKQSLDEDEPAEAQPSGEDWELALQEQNAANDEICGENGRLRAELERLRAEEEADAQAGEPEDEMLAAVVNAVEAVLADWSSSREGGLKSKAACKTEEDEDDDEDEDEEDDEHEVDMSELPPAGLEAGDAGEDIVDDAKIGEPRQETEDTDHSAEMMNDKHSTCDVNESGALEPSEISVLGAGGELHACGESAGRERDHDARNKYHSAVSTAVLDAVRAAFKEDGESSSPSPMYSPAEETAVLVSEKIALRETVEQQQDRIDLLEQELADAGAPPIGNALLTNALTAAGRGFSDAGVSALSAGLSMLSRPETKPKEVARPSVVTVGHEYEVVGMRGAIVRRSEALKSDLVTELPPGSRVRIVAVSERNARRVEIVSVRPGAAADSETARADEVDAEVVLPSSVPKCLDAGPSPDSATASASIAPDDGESLGTLADTDAEVPMDGQAEAVLDNSGEGSSQTLQELPATAPAKELVKGWISASTKDGRLLIRPAPPDCADTPGTSDADVREEGGEEITSVTLSNEEWELLHQDEEASLQRISELSVELHGMGSELLQSFEMKTVSGELASAVDRAQARCARERESAGMAAAELEQLWATICLERRAEHSNDYASGCGGPEHNSQHTDSANGELEGADLASRSNGTQAGCEDVDWDRIVSERETTSAALSAALSRVATLDREREELERERTELEGRRRGEVGGLRAALRRLAKPAVAAMAGRLSGLHVAAPPPVPAEDGSSASSAAEGLFKHRLTDLHTTVAELQVEVSRASASEAALRRSVEARRLALRRVLFRGATADLMNLQCGPFTMPGNADAERRALRSAVEEQLHFNMRLTTSLPTGRTRSESAPAKPD